MGWLGNDAKCLGDLKILKLNVYRNVCRIEAALKLQVSCPFETCNYVLTPPVSLTAKNKDIHGGNISCFRKLVVYYGVCEIGFKYLCSLIANDARYIREIKYRIAMATTTCNKKAVFTIKVVLILREKLTKCYIWSIDLYDVEY